MNSHIRSDYLSVILLADCCLLKLPLDCCLVTLARLDCLGRVLKCIYYHTVMTLFSPHLAALSSVGTEFRLDMESSLLRPGFCLAAASGSTSLSRIK